MQTTRQMIREFSRAFNRPVNVEPLREMSEEDRILLGKLILEECLEYVTDGLGLELRIDMNLLYTTRESRGLHSFIPASGIQLVEDESATYDPIESADALGDMNVVIHFNAHWHGFNLDAITEEIHSSNMSKLAEDGTPIINGVTPGYRESAERDGHAYEPGFDPSKPKGKILKGPNYFKPNLQPIIDAGNWE